MDEDITDLFYGDKASHVHDKGRGVLIVFSQILGEPAPSPCRNHPDGERTSHWEVCLSTSHCLFSKLV